MSGYVIVRELGRGSSGVVSLVRRKGDGRLFAAKEIEFMDEEERHQIMAEVRVMQSLPQHPSLLALEEVLQTRSAITMVVEYSSEGTLRDLVYGDANHTRDRKMHQGLSEDQVVRYLSQLVNAIGFLHQSEVLHRDIKLENLLLFSQRAVVKISDFGTATILGRTSTGHDRMAQTTAGTPHYMSPEVCEGHPYNYKSDVWSLGVVAYEMCTMAVPFQAGNLLALSGKICHQATPDLPQEYSRRLDAIVKAMLTKNQSTRPSMKEVATMLQHYRRRRADEAPDGHDIGGFPVDTHVAPNELFGDSCEDNAGHGPTQSWGAPSLGLPEDDWSPSEGLAEDPSAGFDDGTGSTYQQRYDAVTNPTKGPSSSVYGSSTVLDATQSSEPDHSFSFKQAVTRSEHSNAGKFSPQQRSAIFLEARRQAAENKRNAENEAKRVNHDDEVTPSRTPRLRTLVEEMQDELRKQTQNVDAMMARYGSNTYDSADRWGVGDHELPSESRLQHQSHRTTSPPLVGGKPFVDPTAHTPSAVRKSISPIRPRGIDESASPLYSPRESPESPVSPQNKSKSGAVQESKGVRTTRDGARTPPPAENVGGKKTPLTTPRQAHGKPPTPASKPPSATTSPATKVPRIVVRNNSSFATGSFDASTSGKELPYFPPCAHCIKAAKERRSQSITSLTQGSGGDQQIFLTIQPSKFYCSTCHAPLCETCHLTVHDPMTTITNLGEDLSSAPMPPSTGSTMKRHNVFFLSLFDPSSIDPTAKDLRPPVVAVREDTRKKQHDEEKKVTSSSVCAGCTIM